MSLWPSDEEHSQQPLRWSCRKVKLSAMWFSYCLCVQIVFSTMWRDPASSTTPICVCVCELKAGLRYWWSLAHAARIHVSQVRWEAALVLVCGYVSGCASCWGLLGYNWFLWKRLPCKLYAKHIWKNKKKLCTNDAFSTNLQYGCQNFTVKNMVVW